MLKFLLCMALFTSCLVACGRAGSPTPLYHAPNKPFILDKLL